MHFEAILAPAPIVTARTGARDTSAMAAHNDLDTDKNGPTGTNGCRTTPAPDFGEAQQTARQRYDDDFARPLTVDWSIEGASRERDQG